MVGVGNASETNRASWRKINGSHAHILAANGAQDEIRTRFFVDAANLLMK